MEMFIVDTDILYYLLNYSQNVHAKNVFTLATLWAHGA